LLELDLKILLRKTGARLNFKIALMSLHIDAAGLAFTNLNIKFDCNSGPHCIRFEVILHFTVKHLLRK
jgi:hypothetical protein